MMTGNTKDKYDQWANPLMLLMGQWNQRKLVWQRSLMHRGVIVIRMPFSFLPFRHPLPSPQHPVNALILYPIHTKKWCIPCDGFALACFIVYITSQLLHQGEPMWSCRWEIVRWGHLPLRKSFRSRLGPSTPTSNSSLSCQLLRHSFDEFLRGPSLGRESGTWLRGNFGRALSAKDFLWLGANCNEYR